MALYGEAIEGITNLISEFITDDDLRAKLDFETKKLEFELDKVLLSTTTTPRMDAFVKLLVATRDIIIPLIRPIASVAMACFAAYCTTENIPLPSYVQEALFGAPVLYGTSRHIAKKEEQKTKRVAIQQGIDWEEI